jgi:hypothetical protein
MDRAKTGHSRLTPKTKIITRKESINAAPTSPVEGGKVIPGKPQTQETVEAAPRRRPSRAGKVMPGKAVAITDIKAGQRVKVSYHTVDGKMHATQVQVM